MITHTQMTHSQLKELQGIQYNMLTEVEILCEKYSIPYYLVYGTLLGAVRHQGSIPWDYDIDIAIKREDIHKLMSHKNELPNGLLIEPVCYADVDFCGLVRVVAPNCGEYGNVHIDIFILDYTSKSKFIQTRMGRAMCSFLHMAKLSKNEKRILIELFRKKPLKQLVVQMSKPLNIILGGSARIEKMIYKLRVSSEETDTYTILEDHVVFPTKYLENSVFLQYETRTFQAPAEYDRLLQLWYGNYMEIPPEGIRYMEEEQNIK